MTVSKAAGKWRRPDGEIVIDLNPYSNSHNAL
ncbi:hypothetical protein ACNKW1_06545 [Thauera sp. WH-2]